MGATTFSVIAHGLTPRQAFRAAVEEALSTHGYEGYTGSIAEKSDFIRVPVRSSDDPYQVVQDMFDNDDQRISDKWGPCGCINITGSTYALSERKPKHENYESFIFFGWAPE